MEREESSYEQVVFMNRELVALQTLRAHRRGQFRRILIIESLPGKDIPEYNSISSFISSTVDSGS